MKIIARNDHALKVQVTPSEVASFNRVWPNSELRAERVSGYWFEFERSTHDLIDTDLPEQDDGSAATAMSRDCEAWAFDDTPADWAEDDSLPDGVEILTAIPADSYVVAAYELDRSYGGPEEGGWWFTTGNLVRTLKVFRNEAKANAYASRFNHWLGKVCKPRYSLGSVCYNGGEYAAYVYPDTAPKNFPDQRPHYE